MCSSATVSDGNAHIGDLHCIENGKLYHSGHAHQVFYLYTLTQCLRQTAFTRAGLSFPAKHMGTS